MVHSLHHHHSQSYARFRKRRRYTSLKSSHFLQMYIVLIAQGIESKLFWNVNAYFTKDVAPLFTCTQDHEWNWSMIKVQHWKIYPVHFGGENDMLSNELIKLTSIQCGNKNMGVPISDAIYQGCKKILDDRYVPYIYIYFEYIQFDFIQY